MKRLMLVGLAAVALLPMLAAQDRPHILPPGPPPGPTWGTAWLIDALFM
jgi:hypothetical protein